MRAVGWNLPAAQGVRMDREQSGRTSEGREDFGRMGDVSHRLRNRLFPRDAQN